MRIATKILKAILLAAGKKDIRQYLIGVHINERHIVATDGCRLHAYAHGQEWPHGPVTIPRAAIEMALKAKTVDIEITEVSVGAVSYKPLDGLYPDYMRVIPAVAQLAPISGDRQAILANPDLLVDAYAFIKTVVDKDRGTALALVGGIYTWQTPRAAAVVMPWRDNTSLEQFK